MQKNGVSPSAIFSNPSAKVFNQFEEESILERAKQVYREKSYLERYKPHYKAANVASFLFQGLSALFAFTFGQQLIAGVLPQCRPVFLPGKANPVRRWCCLHTDSK